MDLELLINIGLAIIAWIVTITNLIIGGNKTKKAEKIVNNAIKTVNLAKVVQKIPQHIKEAEELIGNGNGGKKLAIVMEKIKIDCLELAVNYEDNIEGLIQEVEKILDTPQKKQPEPENNIMQKVKIMQEELLLEEKNEKLKGE